MVVDVRGLWGALCEALLEVPGSYTVLTFFFGDMVV